MALNIKFTGENAIELRDKFHDALVGSPAYINSEIALCTDMDPETNSDKKDEFYLVVGNNNKHNMEINIPTDSVNIEDL